MPRRAPALAELEQVVATARSLAVRRAESLVLQVNERGGWTLHREGETDSTSAPLLAARITLYDAGAVTLRFTAFGACWPLSTPAHALWETAARGAPPLPPS
jgi:hypothetical protein